MTQSLSDFFESYYNGNWSWCRDEFWISNKTEMRDIMLEAATMEQDELKQFIKVIFLP